MALRVFSVAWLLRVLACMLLVWGMHANAAQSPVNGIWTTADGSYLMLLQDANSGTTVALEVASDLSSAKAWAGSGDGSGFALNNLKTSADSLTASVSGSSLSGTKTVSGVAAPFSATLQFAYVGGANDGVWQKANITDGYAYLAYMTVNMGGATTTVVVDLAIASDKTYTYDVFLGTVTSGGYYGVSAINLNPVKALKLTFSGSNASGTYTTSSKPPVTSSFTATKILGTEKAP